MNRGPSEVPHRKNAAEWAMWIALQPLRWLLCFRAGVSSRFPRDERGGGADARQ